MARPTKDTEIKVLKELRKIAEKDPMKPWRLSWGRWLPLQLPRR